MPIDGSAMYCCPANRSRTASTPSMPGFFVTKSHPLERASSYSTFGRIGASFSAPPNDASGRRTSTVRSGSDMLWLPSDTATEPRPAPMDSSRFCLRNLLAALLPIHRRSGHGRATRLDSRSVQRSGLLRRSSHGGRPRRPTCLVSRRPRRHLWANLQNREPSRQRPPRSRRSDGGSGPPDSPGWPGIRRLLLRRDEAGCGACAREHPHACGRLPFFPRRQPREGRNRLRTPASRSGPGPCSSEALETRGCGGGGEGSASSVRVMGIEGPKEPRGRGHLERRRGLLAILLRLDGIPERGGPPPARHGRVFGHLRVACAWHHGAGSDFLGGEVVLRVWPRQQHVFPDARRRGGGPLFRAAHGGGGVPSR